ncbi:MAG: PAS domain-containing sensor histidine kinase [Endomicrobiales bacterium]
MEKRNNKRGSIPAQLPPGPSDPCRANDLLEKFFSSTNFLIAHMDRKFNFIRVNAAYANVEGRPPEYFTGKNHFALYPDEENESIFERVVTTGEPYSAYARPFVYAAHPERGVTCWDWNLWPVKDGAGAVEGVLMCLVDATTRALAESELQKTREELSVARRLSDIGRLASTIAHELRSPLAAIRAAVYNVRRKAGDPALQGHLDTIDKKVMESDQIVKNLLSFSRIKALNYEKIAAVDVLNDCAGLMARKYGKGKIVLKKEWGIKEDFVLEADPVHFGLVVNNLLDNAYQAFPDNEGTITVSAEAGGGNLVLRVSDTGCGIRAEDLDRIFEPFFTRKSRGIGLGLALCRQIIALHGGSIDVRSREGAGTTVSVSFPKKRQQHGKESTHDR